MTDNTTYLSGQNRRKRTRNSNSTSTFSSMSAQRDALNPLYFGSNLDSNGNSNKSNRTNSFLDDILARQTSYLNDNLRDGLNLNDTTVENFRRLNATDDNNNNNSFFNELYDDDDDNDINNRNNIPLQQKKISNNFFPDSNIPADNDTAIIDDDEQQNDDDDDDVIFIKEQPIQLSSPIYSTANTNVTATAGANNNYTSVQKKYKKQRTISLPQLPHAKLIYESLQNAPRIQNDDELLHLTGSSTKTLDGNKSVNLIVCHSNSPASFYNHHHSKIANHNGTSLTKRNNLLSLKKFAGAGTSSGYFKTDKDGHYVYQKGDIFGSNGRFVAEDLLGQGTFGKVLKCYDNHTNSFVAVKIIRSVDRYREAAKTELRILNKILENDSVGKYQCLLLSDYFDYKNHICLVTPLYGKSIYDFMCSNGIARFPGSHIQAIARQLIRSVCFLHDLGIIHTDLKPENILLCDESYTEYNLPIEIVNTLSNRRKAASNGGKRKVLKNPEIKIIDFGSAIFHNEYHPPIISTRHYRAPEVVLGLGWSFPCDIWSIACVLIELVIGESLYPIHENFEHLAMMQRINGELIPEKIVSKMFYKAKHKLGNLPNDLSSTVLKHFDKETNTLIWPEVNRRGETVTPLKSIKRVMDSSDRLDFMVSKLLKIDSKNPKFSINWNLEPEQNWELIKGSFIEHDAIDKESFLFWYWFIDLMRKMFEFDPTKRITARDALEHEWFNLGILDDGITNFDQNIPSILN